MRPTLRTIAAAALLATTGSAFAGLSVSSIISPGLNLFSDNSAEQWIDTNRNGILDDTDRLRGILTIETIESGGAAIQIGGQSAYNELTGIYDIVVTSTVPTGGTVFGQAAYNYTFAASGVLGANTAVVIYEDSANDYAREGCGTFAGCEATATGGNVWATFGLGFFVADSALNTPNVGASLPTTSRLGGFSVGMNFITNNSGFQWSDTACLNAVTGGITLVDICGQGGILASGRDFEPLSTPYALYNNIDFKARAVPEPSSIALMGLALAGLGAASRRRNRG